jgi:hypothetical protein
MNSLVFEMLYGEDELPIPVFVPTSSVIRKQWLFCPNIATYLTKQLEKEEIKNEC